MIELDLEQGSLEWHNERAGRVTGTSLQSAIGAKYSVAKKTWTIGDKKVQETLSYSLISERMTEVQIVELNTAAVERGRELEPFAIKAVSDLKKINFQECGMLISEEMQEFGFSPDAVFKDLKDVIVGGLETKCPSSKKHIEYLIKGVVPSEYYWQVLSPFLCSEDVLWWDFASYDDRNYECPLFYIRVNRSDVEEHIEKGKLALKDYLKAVRETHENLVF
tara:strand:+ start:551 stop:1213 length:663 start_codon:yes stop_codon:yes gene_type:complete